MGFLGLTLCVVLCLWRTVIGNTQQTVGPCVVRPQEMSFNCSQRMLTIIPRQIWDNVTALDISQNNLNLSHPETFHKLQRFRNLVRLNLSGNYLPLLEKRSFGFHSFLKVLDLSECQMKSIESGALWGLPKLQVLFLGNNLLQDPLPAALKDLNTLSFLDLYGNNFLRTEPPDWLKTVESVVWPADSNGITKGKMTKELPEGEYNNFKVIQRKLLSNISEKPTSAARNDTDIMKEQSSKSWPYMVAVVVSAITISILLAVGTKCKLLHQYLASYRHMRLAEGDTGSQGVPAGHEMSTSGWDVVDRGPRTLVCEEPDDDGFIEDNYIQDSERERAERPADVTEDEDTDSEIHFSIN